MTDHVFVRFSELPNHHHNKLFRFLNKHAPGWVLTLRPENDLYQAFCDEYDLECEEDFPELVRILSRYPWKRGKLFYEDMLDHRFRWCDPTVVVTHEQATILKLFLPDGLCGEMALSTDPALNRFG